MCVIIYKAAGVPCPDEKILRDCFRANPDGAGIGVRGNYDKGEPELFHYLKGFMTIDSLLQCINTYSYNLTQDNDIIYHFRIGTSGARGREQCHPFPLAYYPDTYKSLTAKSYMVMRYGKSALFAHNGILGNGSDKLSDTQLYCRDVLTPMLPLILEHPDNAKVIIEATSKGSKTILLPAIGEPIITGEWITDKDTGLMFSNMSFKGQYSYGSFADWDYYDDKASDIELAAEKQRKPAITGKTRKQSLDYPCPFCDTGFLTEISVSLGLWECDRCFRLFDGFTQVELRAVSDSAW